MCSVDPKSILGWLFVFNVYEGMKVYANDYAKLYSCPAHTLSCFLLVLFWGKWIAFSTVSVPNTGTGTLCRTGFQVDLLNKD